MDDLHVTFIAELVTAGSPVEVAIELALVGRFYERLGDHAVNLAAAGSEPAAASCWDGARLVPGLLAYKRSRRVSLGPGRQPAVGEARPKLDPSRREAPVDEHRLTGGQLAQPAREAPVAEL